MIMLGLSLAGELTQDNRVSRKDCKIGMQFLFASINTDVEFRDSRRASYVEKMQLVSGRPDAVGKEQHVPLEPGDLLRGEFVTSSRSRHFRFEEECRYVPVLG
jgi:hypothetical protein